MVRGLLSVKLDTDLNVSEGDLSNIFCLIRKSLDHDGKKLRKILDEVVEASGKEHHYTSVRLSNVRKWIL